LTNWAQTGVNGLKKNIAGGETGRFQGTKMVERRRFGRGECTPYQGEGKEGKAFGIAADTGDRKEQRRGKKVAGGAMGRKHPHTGK
jgi:hypothetical protein